MSTRLARVPVRRIVRALADASERWCDADFPPRVRAQRAICERTGYSLPVVEYALDALFQSASAAALEAAIVDEIGSLSALDGAVERAGRPALHALPVGRVCVVSSRTTIGVAIPPLLFALCAKCDVAVKDREDHFVAAFLKTAAEELEELGTAAVAEAWSGGNDARDLAAFDAVVAFGDDVSLRKIRSQAAPRARFVAFGPAASIGYVAREALADAAACTRIAAGAARDMLLYDGEGCLSLHALFLERGGAIAPAVFGEIFRTALDRASVEFPPGPLDARAQARVANARNVAAFRVSEGRGAVIGGSAGYLALLDAPPSEPPSFLPRVVAIHCVDGPADALAYVRAHRLPIEAIALAGNRDDVDAMALETGASRIARFGELQRPPLGGNHGARPRIAEFVRWVTSEA